MVWCSLTMSQTLSQNLQFLLTDLLHANIFKMCSHFILTATLQCYFYQLKNREGKYLASRKWKTGESNPDPIALCTFLDNAVHLAIYYMKVPDLKQHSRPRMHSVKLNQA